MSPPSIIVYGDLVFPLAPPKIVRRQRGLDSVALLWQTDRQDSFRVGVEPPDYPHMRIKEWEPLEQIPGIAYEHRLQCEGLLDGAHKIESDRVLQPEEGWDEGTMVTLTVKPDEFVMGGAHPLHENLICTSVDKEDLNGHVWRVQSTMKGIIATKPVKRRISASGKDLKSEVAFSMIPIPGGSSYGPWKWVVPKQRVEMTDRFLSTTKPKTEWIGKLLVGAEIPTDPPAIVASFVVDLPGSTKNYNYPWGWRVESLNGERLVAGRDIYDVTIQYAYVPIAEVGGSAT